MVDYYCYLRSKESEESHRSKWKTKLLGMFLAVTCQHASGACQSHSRPVLNLREALQKYVELSPTTPPFLTLQFYEKDLTPTPNLLQISGRYSLRSGIFDTPSARAYLFSPLKVIPVTGSVGQSCKPTVGSHRRCHGQLLLQACGVWRHWWSWSRSLLDYLQS